MRRSHALSSGLAVALSVLLVAAPALAAGEGADTSQTPAQTPAADPSEAVPDPGTGATDDVIPEDQAPEVEGHRLRHRVHVGDVTLLTILPLRDGHVTRVGRVPVKLVEGRWAEIVVHRPGADRGDAYRVTAGDPVNVLRLLPGPSAITVLAPDGAVKTYRIVYLDGRWQARRFADVREGHWARTAIERLADLGLLDDPADRFRPDEPATRTDIARLIDRITDRRPDDPGLPADRLPWDVRGRNDAAALGRVIARGLMNGLGDRFAPDGTLTRAQLAAILDRVLPDRPPVDVDITINNFRDGADVPAWARDAVARMVRRGLMAGDQGRLRPQDPVTMAELATLLNRLIDYRNTLR